MAMNFESALSLLKGGRRVAREGWNGVKNGTSMFLYLVDGSTFKVNRAPSLTSTPKARRSRITLTLISARQTVCAFRGLPLRPTS